MNNSILIIKGLKKRIDRIFKKSDYSDWQKSFKKIQTLESWIKELKNFK